MAGVRDQDQKNLAKHASSAVEMSYGGDYSSNQVAVRRLGLARDVRKESPRQPFDERMPRGEEVDGLVLDRVLALATVAAAKPGGRFLELGTGTGRGTSIDFT